MGKKKKTKVVQKVNTNHISSRKLARKEARKSKKQQKHLKRFGKKHLENEKQKEDDQEITKSKNKEDKTPKASTMEDKLEKFKKDQVKHRKKLLLEANLKEDKNLKKLEKQLGLKKRKNTSKMFAIDGLDFILDACDSKKLNEIKDTIEDEQKEFIMDKLEQENESDQESSQNEDNDDDEMEEEIINEESDEEDLIEGEEEEEEDDEFDEDDLNEIEDLDKEDLNEIEDMDANFDEDSSEEAPKENENKTYQDIYGQTRSAKGEVIKTEKYIPPALRAKMVGSDDEKRKLMLKRLQNKVKGLLNRLASSNLGGIARQIEDLYMTHSRNDTNECVFDLLSESLMLRVRTPERLIMEHALLVGILQVNVGVEVGATILQSTVKQFYELYSNQGSQHPEEEESDKRLDNGLMFVCHLYTFKVVDCVLIFELLDMMIKNFKSKDVELILSVLRTVGFGLRKDNPTQLKEIILSIQSKSKDNDELKSDTRIRFMLEVLQAIKNNNVKKIPNYDSEHQQFLLHNMKQYLRPGSSTAPLKVTLNDLLSANERGRWWIVGSAWVGKDGKDDNEQEKISFERSSYSSDLLDLARKMRMNTDVRKNIFCTIMSAEDYLDAFEKVIKLPIKNQKEREISFVILDCCLQEKIFNPYYPQLGGKFARYERKFRMAFQYSIWDKVKILHSLTKSQQKNLALFTYHLIKDSALSLSCLKVIEFADLDKIYVSYLRCVLTSLLDTDNQNIQKIFSSISESSKLKILREGLRLFLRQFILKPMLKKGTANENFKKKITIAENALCFTT